MKSVSIATDVRIPGSPTAATAIATTARAAIQADRRIVNAANRAEGPSTAGSCSSRRRIGHFEKKPGTTRNRIARVAITPVAAWNPNTRIGSSSLTTNDASPSAVVPAESVHGSQPTAIARRAAPAAGPLCRASTR